MCRSTRSLTRDGVQLSALDEELVDLRFPLVALDAVRVFLARQYPLQTSCDEKSPVAVTMDISFMPSAVSNRAGVRPVPSRVSVASWAMCVGSGARERGVGLSVAEEAFSKPSSPSVLLVFCKQSIKRT